ncbi:MAG: serine/threonine protein kinase, partial [Myxococcota bacterium]|nr:serine/threonine protein kinase [Myxococcota bacterium]
MRVEQLGKYQLVQHLASGGMASVYLARVTGPGGFERHVVLKTLRADGVADPSLVPMFLDEARLAALLHHRNIAQVFDVGSDKGTYFLAMEYVHGETLRVVMETALAHGGMLPLGFGVTVLAAAAAGLHHAHERRGAQGVPLGIVHRDVAPSNLIVSYDGSIKLIDFGIAKAAERATHTRTGFIKGKVGYMAPEQILGYPVDRRTDVFALGVLAYEVMTLHRAFAGGSQFEALERTVHSDLVRPTVAVPGFPPEFEEVILTALEIDPDDRYPNADVMRRDLERVAARLGLSIGEEAVLPVLDKLFGVRLEPWMGGTAPRYRVSDRSDAAIVPVLARPALEATRARARGTGATETVAEDEEITTVPRWRTSEEMVTHRLATVEPEAIELPLAAPELEPPAYVEQSWSEGEPPPVRGSTLPLAARRARRWVWA